MEDYIKLSFEDVYENDGLVVFGKGLGIKYLFSKFVQLYSLQETSKRLVFCINATEYVDYITSFLSKENFNPIYFPKIITNEITSQERTDLYAEGGCFFITSRIFIVDLLDRKVDASTVAGLLITNAHKVTDSSIESFIIRVFRDKNRNGFIKAFTDEPESLISGFGKIEKLLKLLYIKKLYLYPRFQISVSQALERHQPEVIELALNLTDNMKAIQSSVLVAMNSCLSELKKALPHLDTSFMSLENGLFRSFDYSIRNQLDPEWHRISPRTKQLVNDITSLRRLLDYLLRYDAYTFYSFLLSLKSASALQSFPSLWLTSQAADLLFRKSKDRIYSIINMAEDQSPIHINKTLKPNKESSPKWTTLLEIIFELQNNHISQSSINYKKENKISNKENSHQEQSTKIIGEGEKITDIPKAISNRILILVKDERTAIHVRDLVIAGDSFILDQRHRWFISQQCEEIRTRATKSSSSSSFSNKGNHYENPYFRRKQARRDDKQSHLPDTVVENVASSSSSSAATTDCFNSDILDQDYLGLNISKKIFDSLSDEKKLLLLHESELKLKLPVLPEDTRTRSNKTKIMQDSDRKTRQNLKRKISNGMRLNISDNRDNNDDDRDNVDYNELIEDADATYDQNVMKYNLDNTGIFNSIPFRNNIPAYLYCHVNHLLNRHSKTNLGISYPSSTIHNPTSSDNHLDTDSDDAGMDNQKSFDLSEGIFHVVILTHHQLLEPFNVLGNLRPGSILLYDVDVSVVRDIEIYHSMCPSQELKVYLFIYEGSVEEHRYVSSLGKEKRAFEQLITAKETLVVNLPDHIEDIEREKIADRDMDLVDTRAINKMKESASLRLKVVVDVRDFRSSLPSLLYAGGFTVIPRTLLVGDFILSPEICVERKGIVDLFQSLASGRLYNQAEGMSRYYKYPCLLIEFTLERAFCLQSISDIPTDSIQTSSVSTRMVQLAITFPQLRFLWSRSPHLTVDIFKAIMQHHDEVDVDKAVQAGSDDMTILGDASGDNDVDREDIRATAQDFLLSLPGITVHNYRAVMNQVENIAELSKLDVQRLSPIIGSSSATKLVEFFKQKITI